VENSTAVPQLHWSVKAGREKKIIVAVLLTKALPPKIKKMFPLSKIFEEATTWASTLLIWLIYYKKKP
jgi:hypothetical protein